MKWFIVVLLTLFISHVFAILDKRTKRLLPEPNSHFRNHPKRITEDELQPDSQLELELPEVEIDSLFCPLGCVCQLADFKDLSISRWINYMQKHDNRDKKDDFDEMDYEKGESRSSNEAENDYFLINRPIKQATCILQDNIDVISLVNSLPHDLQSLILLYTSIGRNMSINTSILKPLNQLHTLEIRGPNDRTFQLVFDEPLSFLQYANFESITLLGSETFQRPKNPVHPSEVFDYKPKSELLVDIELQDPINSLDPLHYKIANAQKLSFESKDQKDETEILSYEEYVVEMKKVRMPSFYGWKQLEVLRIHECQLSELYWEMFDDLTSLEHLSLERNGINIIPPFTLFGALHMKTLSLAHNEIHDLHYLGLAGLLELEVLNLSNNKLGQLSELSFPPFPRMQYVDFRQNPIRYIYPMTFGVMNRTETLMFDSNEVSLELNGNMTFDSLHKLRMLSIGNVSIANLEQNIFKGLTALEILNLKGDIHNIEFDAFTGLVELRDLDLSDCKINTISMDAFIGCKSLEKINLSRNNITQLPPGLFDDQNLLEEIYLESNQLQALSTTFFLQPKMRIARLSDNPWKCSCDMYNWRSKITNQERTSQVEKCIRDFKTGKKIACHMEKGYKFDHRHAPRCKSHNGRSVFYVLRKQLQCGQGRIIHHYPDQKLSIFNAKKNRPQQQPQPQLHIKSRKEKKLRYILSQENNINYFLHRDQRRLNAFHNKQSSQKQSVSIEEISNEI